MNLRLSDIIAADERQVCHAPQLFLEVRVINFEQTISSILQKRSIRLYIRHRCTA